MCVQLFLLQVNKRRLHLVLVGCGYVHHIHELDAVNCVGMYVHVVIVHNIRCVEYWVQSSEHLGQPTIMVLSNMPTLEE